MVDLTEIKRSLQSATLKHRREAVKQLELQLASPWFLRQLDVNTVKLWPQDKLQVLSWPGLADIYLNYMHKEVTEHKKQLDAAAIKVFKTIFTAADNTERCGPGRNNLLRRAGAAFDKFGKMLEAAPEGEGFGTALGKEVASVLLKVLLPNPLYCQRGTVIAFQGLMEEAMLRSETLRQLLDEHAAKTAQQAAAATATGRLAPAPRGAGAPSAAAMQQELFLMANVLTGLLSGVPGQLAGPFIVDVVAFLAQSLAWLDKKGEYGRTSRQLMACLNGLLLSYGADLRPHLPSTYKATGSYIKHAWTAHTSVPVKDGVLCFCRLSLALGSIPTAGGGVLLSDLLSSVTKEINTQGFSWDLQHNKQHQQLAPLAASLYYHASFASAAGATASSTPHASGGTGSAEVGSCGSNGEGAGRHTQIPGKRRASNADAGKTAPAADGASGDEGTSDDDEVLQLPRKRSRVLGAAGHLLLHLQTDPERWAPVVALLLHQHGPLVPPAFLAALQQQLTASAARCLSALGHQVSQAAAGSSGASGVPDRRSASPAAAGPPAAGTAASIRAAQLQQQQLLWLARCLCELALCWPAALHPLAAPAGRGAGVRSSGSAASPGGVLWDDVGVCYNSSDGSCTQQAWLRDEVSAARASCSGRWQQLWESCLSILAAAGQHAVLTVAALQDSVAWLLHVLAAQKLAQLPASKTAVLMGLQRFWLPAQEGGPAGQQEEHAQLQQQVVLTDAQLALLLSLCLGQQVSSHKEVQVRQQLLQACLSTAEAWSSSGSSRRASRFSSGARAGSMGPPAPVAVLPSAVSTPGKTLPDLLLPAMLALLGAPDLPTPSLNVAPAAATMGSAAAAKLAAMQSGWLFPAGTDGSPATAAAAAAAAAQSAGTWADGALGSAGGSDAAGTVWYAAAEVWWGGDQQLEAQLAGLETGLDTLQRQLAAQQRQQVLRAAAAASAASASTAASSAASVADDALHPNVAAAILVGWEPDGTVKQEAVPAGLAEQGADTGWWECWCRLADEAAEHLCNVLLPCTPAGQDTDAAHPWDDPQEAPAADGMAASDPVQHLSYLLLLLNVSVSLPSVAALQLRLHEQQQQQLAMEKHRQHRDDPDQQAQNQQQGRPREEMFCGFGFSGHAEQHLQLQQLVMEVAIKAGQLLADNLQHLPCQPGSTWLQQLMHLGVSLARIQALMTALPTAQGPDSSQVKYQMLAAASFLAEVVKVLERLTTQTAAAASALPDEDMDGGAAGGDADFDDDFMDAAPAASSRRPACFGSTQQPAASMMATPAASFRPTQTAAAFTSFTGTAAGAAAAGGSTAGGGASGPAVLVGGGLAGFSGRADAGLGNPSAIWSPALLPAPHSSSSGGPSQPGFAVGGLAEGLSGLAGVEGAGLRVFAALSPAYRDTAQALMRLWRHMAGLAGWAPPDALLQAVGEAATTAICAGGWIHLPQLFGLMTGSNVLLSAQKVPTSTCHLVLRLLQQVAAAAAAADMSLDMPYELSSSQPDQLEELSSQHEPGGHHTFLSVMLSIFEDVQRRLGVKHDQPAAVSHLPNSTQLQLGLTTLALLQLQPQAGIDSTTTAAGSTAELLAGWRRSCLLRLLDSRSSLCRVRAGPLIAALLTALAASAAPATPGTDGAGSSGSTSMSRLVNCAVMEAVDFMSMQGSATLTEEQTDRVRRRQAAQQQMQAAGAAAGSARRDWEATNRGAQQEALLWEIAVVQLADLAQAAPAVAAVALQQQEPPNVLDASMLLFLLTHTACVQLLPDDTLPQQAPGSAAGGSQASSSGDASGAQARAMRTAAVALDAMASQQQYSSRFAYLQYHAGYLLREWVAGVQPVQQLLAVQSILCPAPGSDASTSTVKGSTAAALQAALAAAGAASGLSEGAAGSASLQLLQAYGCRLLFWLIYFGSRQELAALAAAAGLEEAALLQAFTHELCSQVYPMLKVPELKTATDMFREKLPANADNLTNEDSFALVFSLFEMSLPVLHQPPGEWHPQQQTRGLRLDVTLPFITQAAADKGLASIAKLWSNTHWLVALPFSQADMQVLLLMVQRSLVAAAHPLHKLQRLGQLQCLLRQLPDEQLREPSVARSLIGMLLQHLQVPELQGFCCSCLQRLLGVYSNALPTLYDDQGMPVAAGPSSADKVATSTKEKQLHAQSKDREKLLKLLLKELLPPVVAALVQCVETAAAGLQLLQQQHLWALQVSSTDTAPGVARPTGGSAPLDLPSSLAPVSTLLSTCSFLETKGMGRLTLNLLPPLPVLAAAAKEQGWQSQEVRFLLPWFVARAASMTASSRQRAAQELLSKMRHGERGLFQTKHDLWQLTGQAPDVMLQPGNRELKYVATDRHYFAERVPCPHLVTASFELARLGAQLGDPLVMQLAAELLAVIGPMDPDVITLDHSAAAALSNSSSGVHHVYTHSASRSSGSAAASHTDRTAFPLKAVLALLVDSLFDEQPHVVSTAQDSMAALVSALGNDVLSALQPPARKPDQEQQGSDRLLQSYVSTYVSSRGSSSIKQAPTPGAVAAALQAAASVELWSPVGKPYSSWLCDLSSTLLRACGGVQDAVALPAVTRRTGRSAAAAASIPGAAAVLALLADAAAINSQLAELLLPHAVLKLCESDCSGADVPGAGSQGWAARLGAAASAGLQLDSLTGSPAAMWQADGAAAGALGDDGGVSAAAAAGGTVDPACYSVLLSCLEQNRSVHQAAWSSMPCDPAPAPVAWQRCFCLHLDYLPVAAAAMAVKAYFTALLYVEHCCSEMQREGRNPFQGTVADSGIMHLQQLAGVGAANGVDGGQQPVAKQRQQLLESLLLQLYSNINEPDGVYAVVAAFGSPASQLQLLQHEQRWAAVLGGQDALLQAAVLQPLGQQQQGGSLHAAGALTALQRFGCPATAQKCIAGVLQDQQQQQAHTQDAAPYLPLPSSLAEPGRQQHLQQQQAQQLLETQSELAWRLSDWGLADTLNPAAAQQGWGTGFQPSSTAPAGLQAASAAAGQQGSSFHAAVLGALTALQHRDHDGFTAHVSGAQQECVLRLARSSTQSAAAINPLLVQLQMLQMLSKGALVAKSSQVAAPQGAADDWPAKAAEAFLSVLAEEFCPEQGASSTAVKLSGVNFELSDQLLSLQAALSKVLRRPDALLATLQGTMRVARRAGQFNFAAAALQQLQETLRQAVLGAKLSAHGPLGLGLHAAALAAPGAAGSGSAGAQLPGWIQRAVAAESGWPLEAVKIRWLQGQHQAALKELQGLEQQLAALFGPVIATQTFSSPNTLAASNLACALMRARMQLGKWLAAGEGSTSNVQGAMQQLQAALAVAQAVNQHRDFSGGADLSALHCSACYQLALCADQQYQVLDAQMASPEFEKQQQVLQTKQQLFEQLKSAVTATQNWARQPHAKQASAKQAYQQVVRRYAETQRQVELDRLAVSQLQDSRMQYLIAALGAYRSCIAAGDGHDLQAVYRMCGLWFRHSDNNTVNQVMLDTFQQVPTAKFVPLVYQIASRMDNTQSPFQVVLTGVLFLMAKDHPYHTLYPLIALSNGDTEGGDPAAKNAHIRHETNTARVAAASALLQRVRAVGSPLEHIVDDMTAQVTDLIGMTLQVHKALPRQPNSNQVAVDQYTMPANFRRRLKSLQHAPPICYTLPLDTSCNYGYVPYVVEIDSIVKIAGGINTPLIIRTTDDSGRTQRQLCKCNDDLRQDAVMQQFFGLVDTLLKGSPDSKQRRLGYRTYRVVPCSPLVGVLEWVEGTTPMTEYLLGSREANPPYSGGASGRYHAAGDWTWMECYLKMDKAQPKTLREDFLNCCKHFPPVFRHFFLEAFPDPSEWFEARTRYTRSTAVASMAGAVIGLGDRHLGNILLDMHSAEVVHIDLGIAFEQGLFLQTAERVPFRLTANIVDGMGAAGVEGTFRRCCETTMQVLRQHQDALLTVVQVVLHDPLYRWQMTPVKAGRKQQDPMAQQQADADAAGGGDGSAAAASAGTGTAAAAAAAGVSSGALGNADAERAVLRVKQKLQGQDVEGGAALSVEAQVAAMLQAARDPERLCRMFKGWAAWV